MVNPADVGVSGTLKGTMALSYGSIQIPESASGTTSALAPSLGHRRDSQKIVVYWQRWPMLLMFGLSSFMNAALWICFAPIQKQASEFFHVSSVSMSFVPIPHECCLPQV